MNSKEIYDYIIRIQAIAKIGLVYSKDPYAITNYHEINDLSKKFLEDFENVKFDRPNYFEKNVYPTPNVSVRVVIFNKTRDKILLVRETNSKQYSLPGGWCDLYDSPSETAINETRQEAGGDIDVIKLVGITDRRPFQNPTSIPSYVIVFEGVLKGELHEHEYETDDVGFFDINDLPNISRKISLEEMNRMINAALNGETIFD